MIGYHLTPARNLPSILEHGLEQRRLRKSWYDGAGIFVFRERPVGQHLILACIHRAGMHQALQIAVLEVNYDDRWCHIHGTQWDINHESSFCEWKYENDFPVHVLTHNVPPERIAVLGVLDLARPAGIEAFDTLDLTAYDRELTEV